MKRIFFRTLTIINIVLVVAFLCLAGCFFVLAASQRAELFGYTALVAEENDTPTFFVTSKSNQAVQPNGIIFIEQDGSLCAERITHRDGDIIYYMDETQTLTSIDMRSSQWIGCIVLKNETIGRIVQFIRRPQTKWGLTAGGIIIFFLCGSVLVLGAYKKKKAMDRAYYETLLEEFLHPKQQESEEMQVFEIQSAEIEPVVCADTEEMKLEEAPACDQREENDESVQAAEDSVLDDEMQECTEPPVVSEESEEETGEQQDTIRWELVEQEKMELAEEEHSLIRSDLIEAEQETLVFESEEEKEQTENTEETKPMKLTKEEVLQ